MHALADWNSKAGSDPLPYQDQYNNNAASLIKQTVIFLYIVVDLFVHSSGPFGGPFFLLGGFIRTQRPPPPRLRPCMMTSKCPD